MSKNLNGLVETAIFSAIAMALSFIPDFASWFSPSFGTIPLVIFALRRGLKYGLSAGFIWGLLHFILGKVYYLGLLQVIIEYLIAFAVMGLAGLLTHPLQASLKAKKTLSAFLYASLGASLAVGVRYFFHYLAGVIFWSSYAPEDMSAEWYSFTVNGIAGSQTLIITLVVLLILVLKTPHFFLPQKR